MERSRFRSWTGMARAPGNLCVGWLAAMLGLRPALMLGFLVYTAQASYFSCIKTGQALRYSVGSFFLNPLRMNLLSAALSAHANAAGFAQGELRGAITNLGSLIAMFSTLAWSKVYAYGVRNSWPGFFWIPIAIVTMMETALLAGLPREKQSNAIIQE